ncbi:hypothetical protein [Nocardioides sp. REDSEA-S30_B4]|uniref:hypothetical protein n=1 Tax=Nocardioides sp. REDSEA-S30_B4 TaxID=1811552 RepID=UPI0025EFFE95|nr:hypothetical protein [Nocardioides sp. REDSEA-S30_B4]
MQVRVYGLRRGRPVPVTSVVDSLIQDGSFERLDRHDNREQQVILAIESSDSLALAEYEAAMFLEAQKPRNELRWTPPDGFGATGVFDVLWADLEFLDTDMWDLEEVQLGRRNYLLTFRCLPFARSVDPFTVTGVTSTGTTTTTINDATSATGWSAVGGTFGQSGSEVAVEVEAGTFVDTGSLIYAPASPVDMTSRPYLRVTWRPDGLYANDPGPTVFADGVSLARLATEWLPSGKAVSTFACPDASVDVFRIKSPRMAAIVGTSTTGSFKVDKLEKSDVAPTTTTLRQKVTAVNVPGSARTPVSLSLSHETDALGDVLIYTSPALAAGYVPALSPFATSSGSTEAGNVSGRKWTNLVTFDVPAAMLPRGSFQLVVRSLSGSAIGRTVFTSTANTRLNGVTQAPTLTEVVSVPRTSNTAYRYVNLGSFELPPASVPETSSALVRVTIDTDSSETIDEAWLFYLPDDESAHVSQIQCGTGTPSAGGPASRVWLDSPSVEREYPAAYIGTAEDRADAVSPSGVPSNWDEHRMVAGENLVFAVTPGALDALVSVTGYAAWHTHPADPAA